MIVHVVVGPYTGGRYLCAELAEGEVLLGPMTGGELRALAAEALEQADEMELARRSGRAKT